MKLPTLILHSQFGQNSFNSSKAPSSTSTGPARKGKVGDIRAGLTSSSGGAGVAHVGGLDLEATRLSLSASKNSAWMTPPKDRNLEESFKRSMRSTASKLGRKLIAMDKESEVRQAEKATRRIIKKNTPNQSPETPQWRKF